MSSTRLDRFVKVARSSSSNSSLGIRARSIIVVVIILYYYYNIITHIGTQYYYYVSHTRRLVRGGSGTNDKRVFRKLVCYGCIIRFFLFVSLRTRDYIHAIRPTTAAETVNRQQNNYVLVHLSFRFLFTRGQQSCWHVYNITIKHGMCQKLSIALCIYVENPRIIIWMCVVLHW